MFRLIFSFVTTEYLTQALLLTYPFAFIAFQQSSRACFYFSAFILCLFFPFNDRSNLLKN